MLSPTKLLANAAFDYTRAFTWRHQVWATETNGYHQKSGEAEKAVFLHDEFEISPLPKEAADARARVRRFAASVGFDRDALDEIEIAVGEAVTNAILYGSPDLENMVSVSSAFHDKTLEITIRDRGRGFDPHALRDDAGTDALGGRGVRLMRALMHRLDLHYDGSGMTVTLCRRLTS